MEGRRAITAGYLLTAIAGWVDAQGFLALKGVFVSFMSGNTTLLGVFAAQEHWAQARPVALVIGLFLAGGFLGAVLSGAVGRRGIQAVLLLEAAILAAALAVAVGFGATATAAVILALAMGVQNAAVVATGPVKAGATYVTGTLVSAGLELGKLAGGTGSRKVLAGHLTTWAALFAGVAAGALADRAFGISALIVPCAAAFALAAWPGERGPKS
jgi:uncharacterized membrane protein YoaK (UPF0700 family)